MRYAGTLPDLREQGDHLGRADQHAQRRCRVPPGDHAGLQPRRRRRMRRRTASEHGKHAAGAARHPVRRRCHERAGERDVGDHGRARPLVSTSTTRARSHLNEYMEHDWRLEARLRVTRVPAAARLSGTRRAATTSATSSSRCPCCGSRAGASACTASGSSSSPLTMQQPVVCPDKEHAERQVQATNVPGAIRRDLRTRPPRRLPLRQVGAPAPQPQLQRRTSAAVAGWRRPGGPGRRLRRAARGERIARGASRTRAAVNGEEHTTLTDQPRRPTTRTVHRRPAVAGRARGRLRPADPRALRAAGNVYFPKVESSIYLPRKEGAVSAEMHELLRQPDVAATHANSCTACSDGADVTAPDRSATTSRRTVPPISDDELMAGYRDLFGIGRGSAAGDAGEDGRRAS